MIVFPNAKINLGLHVIRKRSDGFHDIETVFFPIPLYDILEVMIKKGESGISFSATGIALPGKENICVQAAKAFEEQGFLAKDGVMIHLHKQIPAGAGLGGGSSDAASTISLLHQLLHSPFTEDELNSLASRLGSDCPFFLLNNPSLGTGRGTELTPVSVNLSGYRLLLIFPPFPVSTAEAYAGIVPKKPAADLSSLMSLPPEQWKGRLKNDFEETVFKKNPVLGEIKEWLYASGAVYASMSGSGSTMFGIFREKREIMFGNDCEMKWLILN